MSAADLSAGRRVAAREAVAMASDLIAFDTSNHGDPHVRGTERPAAEYVAGRLADVGYDVTYLESGAPGRGNVVARLPGADPSRGALLLHGHLDVVPADAADWSVHPFSGEVRDGYVWGRGAVDMKGAVAIMLAVARRLRREGAIPPRDLIFAFVADEEAGGWHGARWLVDNRPDLFEGATEAIGEVGGFSVTLGSATGGEDVRAYLVQTAEKGSMWLRLAARGRGGHGSMLHDGNAIATLAAAVARLDVHRFPLVLTEPIRALLTGIADITGIPFDEADPQSAVDRLGPLARLIGAALRDTANVTLFDAGYRSNVVPVTAHATVDGRFLPGREEAFGRELVEVLGPGVRAAWDTLPPVRTDVDGALMAAIAAAIEAEDPGARVLPYLLAAGTDAKSFQRLGIRHLGFTPLRLPPELDFSALFHGVDERVPVAALEFGTRVLDRLLRTC
ncbi:M20/M25/M40 family metallo-hydrolase [Frankia sp. AvcI1]|uniref:M20/M25/M40 family metallo-hydrolase n=2 Tax=Frankia sp. AvcI1 TaxID=573496 RepID=UPI00211846B9|nr:M20/M25/M40 family metallo-hydrolase [Frankia sp. AvcI1]